MVPGTGFLDLVVLRQLYVHVCLLNVLWVRWECKSLVFVLTLLQTVRLLDSNNWRNRKVVIINVGNELMMHNEQLLLFVNGGRGNNTGTGVSLYLYCCWMTKWCERFCPFVGCNVDA